MGTFTPKAMDIKCLMQYLSLGRDGARQFGEDAKASFHYGNRILFDREMIDKHVEELRNEENK